MTGRRALILVDVQNDFCEGGSLAVTGGAEVARRIGEFVPANADRYAAIVATADWHEEPGDHWSETPDFRDSWPVHCKVGSDGALFHPAAEPAYEHVQIVFRKGRHEAAYSGFEGHSIDDGRTVGLAEWLRDKGIDTVDVAGIATDHCVKATALDSAREGFRTTVLLDLTAGVAPDTTQDALNAFSDNGIHVYGAPVAP